MSFHNKGLLGEGSSPGTPLSLDEEESTRKKLRTLSSDPLSRDLGDPEFMDFKTKQFERAYPGKQDLDASGRAIDSPPVVKDIEPFKPKVKRRDLDFGAPVGAGEKAKNDLSDLIGAKRGLSNTKLFAFDVTKERSDEAGKRFTDAVKLFQTNRGLKIDGLMNPEGPTVKALRGLLFPPGTASNVGQPVDLSRVAARPLATPVVARAALGDPTAAKETAPQSVNPPGTAPGGPLLAHAAAPKQPAPGTAPKDPWPQSPVSPTFREEIHKRESRKDNYQAVNRDDPKKPALGRYQLRPGILQDIGMKDAKGNWTGKYGVTSESDFLKNALAQEKAFADALAKYDQQLRSLGVMSAVGRQVSNPHGSIIVTGDGLAAAAHREGAEQVRQYLEHQRKTGWRSNYSGLPTNKTRAFGAIDKRLRDFEKVARKKNPVAP